MTTVEPQERFICAQCGREFRSAMSLKGHLGAHKNKGRYECEICSKEGVTVYFDLPQALGSHMHAKHGIPAALKSERRRKRRFEKEQEKKADFADFPIEDLIEGFTPEEKVWQRVVEPPANGAATIDELITTNFLPLANRYKALQERQTELLAELEHGRNDLAVLWEYVKVVADRYELVKPEESGVQQSVQVAFQKVVSDGLMVRAEEWLRNRRTSFTSNDIARGLAVAPSTGTNVISEMRSQGKVRLVGKKGRAHSFVSTINGG
jgi:DNA-directed RNA polymerase subunit RPC12/RpoP